MPNNTYTCSICNDIFSNHNKLANHIRWHHKPKENTSSKFQLKCCCVECKKELSAQNIKLHSKKHNNDKKIKSYCPQCDNPIYNKNKFCSKSCSSTYTNNKKDWSKMGRRHAMKGLASKIRFGTGIGHLNFY